MSSYLSKSKKVFRPKAAVRRTAVITTSSQSSPTHSRTHTPQLPTSNLPPTSPPIVRVRSVSPAHRSSEKTPSLGLEASRVTLPESTARPSQDLRVSEGQRNISSDLEPVGQDEVITNFSPLAPSSREPERHPRSLASSPISPSRNPDETRRTNPLGVSIPLPAYSQNATTTDREDDTARRAPVERIMKRRKLGTPSDDRSVNVAVQVASDSDARCSRSQDPGIVEPAAYDGSAGASSMRKPKATRSSRRQNKKKQRLELVADAVTATAQATVEGDDLEGDRPRRRGRKRAVTPENAERVEIAPTLVKMSDLCRDSHTGKKSSRESRLQERDKEVKTKNAREHLHSMMDDPGTTLIDSQTEEPHDYYQSASKTIASNKIATRLAPQVRLVNGQIVQDEDSRMIDRHEQVEASRLTEEICDEDELTRRVTSFSYAKRPQRKTKWDAEQTNRFYDGLRLFGTDFMTINRIMFPRMTRRAIKTKFTNEERADEELIKRILIQERRVPTLEEIESMSQTTLRDPSEVYKGMQEDKERLEDEARREKEAMDGVERQRANEVENEALDEGEKENEDEEVVGPTDDRDGENSGIGNGGRRKKGGRGLSKQRLSTKRKKALASADGDTKRKTRTPKNST